MHIGILQTGHPPEPIAARHGHYDRMFSKLLGGHGFSFSGWDVEGMTFPASIHDADGWLITGSRHGAYEDHPFVPPLEAFIRDAYAANIPLVGICFGHQIVAQALGGEVVKWPDGWAVGRRAYEVEGSAPVTLNAWHQDQVTRLPTDARPLARNTFCEHAMLAYGDRIFTVQPHPEFGPDVMGEFVAIRRGTGTYPDAMMAEAARDATRDVDQARLGQAIGHFFLTRQIHV